MSEQEPSLFPRWHTVQSAGTQLTPVCRNTSTEQVALALCANERMQHCGKKKKAAAACYIDWLVNAAQRVGVIPRTHAGDVWRYLTKTEGCVTFQTSTGGAVSFPVLWLSGVVLRNCAKLSRLSSQPGHWCMLNCLWICFNCIEGQSESRVNGNKQDNIVHSAKKWTTCVCWTKTFVLS